MRERNQPQSVVAYVFESVMSIVYLAIAYTFLFTTLFNRSIVDPTFRTVLGVMFGIYGLMRIYRSIRKIIKHNKH